MLVQTTKNDCFVQKKSIQESDYLIQYLCDIHTLQLVIEDTFAAVEGMAEMLKKCKALAKLTHTSTTLAAQQLKTAAAKSGGEQSVIFYQKVSQHISPKK